MCTLFQGSNPLCLCTSGYKQTLRFFNVKKRCVATEDWGLKKSEVFNMLFITFKVNMGVIIPKYLSGLYPPFYFLLFFTTTFSFVFPSLWLPLPWRSCCHSVVYSFSWWENHPRVSHEETHVPGNGDPGN
jgi:hypothetical protein